MCERGLRGNPQGEEGDRWQAAQVRPPPDRRPVGAQRHDQAAGVSARWSLDFVPDSFGASRKFRILAVIYDCRREHLCLIADTSISGARVVRELNALVRIYGTPACIVSDSAEFLAKNVKRSGR